MPCAHTHNDICLIYYTHAHAGCHHCQGLSAGQFSCAHVGSKGFPSQLMNRHALHICLNLYSIVWKWVKAWYLGVHTILWLVYLANGGSSPPKYAFCKNRFWSIPMSCGHRSLDRLPSRQVASASAVHLPGGQRLHRWCSPIWWDVMVIAVIAIEHGPFIDDLPTKNGDFPQLC